MTSTSTVAEMDRSESGPTFVTALDGPALHAVQSAVHCHPSGVVPMSSRIVFSSALFCWLGGHRAGGGAPTHAIATRARHAHRQGARGRRPEVQGPEQERKTRRVRGLAQAGGRAGRRPRVADDARGEGRADGQPDAADGPDGAVNEESRPMPNPFGGPSWSLPGTSEARAEDAHPAVHQPRQHQPADDGRRG